MKRIAGLLTLLLLVLLHTQALAVSGNGAVYEIIRHTADGDTVLGTAAAISEDCLITADAAVCDPSEMLLKGENGVLTVESVAVDRLSIGLALITANGKLEETLTLTQNAAGKGIAVLADGSELYFQAQSGLRMRLGDTYDGLSMQVPEGAMPGAVLLSADGKLAGICVASVGEGSSRAAVLTGESIYAMLAGGDQMQEQTEQAVVCTVENGILTIDIGALMEDGVNYTVMVSDEGNAGFGGSVTIKADVTTTQLVATPGRTMLILVWKEGEENDFSLIRGITEYTVPDAERFTRYGYHDDDPYMTLLPTTEGYGDSEVIPRSEITEDKLLSGEYTLYLAADSQYEVEQTEECSLTCVMTTPEGRCIALYSGFVFDQKYMPHDTWHWDVTELFTTYLRMCENQPSAGVYTFTYYIDGGTAGTASFVLNAASASAK